MVFAWVVFAVLVVMLVAIVAFFQKTNTSGERVSMSVVICILLGCVLGLSRTVPNGFPISGLEDGATYNVDFQIQQKGTDEIFLHLRNTGDTRSKVYKIKTDKLLNSNLEEILEVPENFKVAKRNVWIPGQGSLGNYALREVFIVLPPLPPLTQK